MSVIFELDRPRLRETLAALGVPDSAIKLAHEFYACPRADWIQQDFALTWSSLRAQMGFVYHETRRNCVNFAQWAAAWASEFHAETPGAPDSALAFGEVWCSARKHAFNVAVHRWPQGNLLVAFYEPQPSANGFSFQRTELTAAEIASIHLLKL